MPPVPVLVLLGGPPGAPDTRLPMGGITVPVLTGDPRMFVASFGLIVEVTLKGTAVEGGSGSGLGVEIVLWRLIGDCSRVATRGRGTEVFCPVMNS